MIDIPLSYILVLFVGMLVLLSGLFSASETAFLAASKARLYTQARQGNKKALRVLRLVEKLERLVGTVLICNNLVNILATSLTTATLTYFFGEAGVLYATVMMTILIVIYAEVVPKLLAINKSEQIARFVAPLMTVLVKVISPLTVTIEWIAKGSLKMLGVRVDPGTHLTSSLEELRGAIDLHHTTTASVSASESEDRAMLHSILDLSEVDVGEVMVHRQEVMMLNALESPSKILTQLVQSPYTRFPVWAEDPENIVGVLNVKDFLRALQVHGANIDQMDLMKSLSKPWFVPETANLKEQLQAFQSRQEHIALVVDEYGSYLGIVTLEDIVEEIVGEIIDEHDDALPGVWRTKTGDIFVSGKTTLRDLNRRFGWALPDDNAATLAGLVIHESQTIPKVGQIFQINRFRIKVARRRKNHLTLLKIMQEHQAPSSGAPDTSEFLYGKK